MEVSHRLILRIVFGMQCGIVRSPVSATLPQIASRLFLVWGVLYPAPQVLFRVPHAMCSLLRIRRETMCHRGSLSQEGRHSPATIARGGREGKRRGWDERTWRCDFPCPDMPSTHAAAARLLPIITASPHSRVLPFPCAPIPVCPHSRVPPFPCAPIPVCPHSRVPPFPCAPIPVCPHSRVPPFPCAPIPVCPHSRVPPFPCAPIPVCPHSRVPPFPCAPIPYPLHLRCKGPDSHEPHPNVFMSLRLPDSLICMSPHPLELAPPTCASPTPLCSPLPTLSPPGPPAPVRAVSALAQVLHTPCASHSLPLTYTPCPSHYLPLTHTPCPSHSLPLALPTVEIPFPLALRLPHIPHLPLNLHLCLPRIPHLVPLPAVSASSLLQLASLDHCLLFSLSSVLDLHPPTLFLAMLLYSMCYVLYPSGTTPPSHPCCCAPLPQSPPSPISPFPHLPLPPSPPSPISPFPHLPLPPSPPSPISPFPHLPLPPSLPSPISPFPHLPLPPSPPSPISPFPPSPCAHQVQHVLRALPLGHHQ
ncbi:unnamed protein product [Closterium sp. Naga37s-1]|nr:unnamed protein product [Closterium sp. Naga37s-1]